MSLVASVYVGRPKHAAVPAVKTTATTITLTHKPQRVAGGQDQQLSRATPTINPQQQRQRQQQQQRSFRQLSSVMPTVCFKALPLSDIVAVNNIRTTIATTQILPVTAAATTTITTAETVTNHKLNPLSNAKNHHSKYQSDSYVTMTTTAKSAPTRYGDETLAQRRNAKMLLAAAKERELLGGETPAQRTAARANLINYNLNVLMVDAKLVCDQQTICKCQQQRRQRRWAAAIKQQREVVRRKGTTRDVPAAATGALTAATARTMTKIERLAHYPYRDKDYERRGLTGAALAIATTTTTRHLLHIVRKLCLVLALLLSILTLQHANCQQLMPLTAANKTATITTTTAAVAVDGTATVTVTATTTTSTAFSVLQATIQTPTIMATAAFKKRAYTFLRTREEHLSSISTNNPTTKTTQTEAHAHHRKPAPCPTKHGPAAATNFGHKADIAALGLVQLAASSIKQQRTNGKSEEKPQFQAKEEKQKLQEVKEDEKEERRQVQEQEQLQKEEAKQQKQLQKVEEKIIEEEHKQQQLTSQLLQSRANKHDQQRPNAATVDNHDNAAIINSNMMTDSYETANNFASGHLWSADAGTTRIMQFVQQSKDKQQQQQTEQAIEASLSSDIVTSHQRHNYDFTKNASSQAASAFASALTQGVAENSQNTPHQINATYAHSLIVFSNLIYDQTNSRNIIHNHNSNNLITTTTAAATSAGPYDNAQLLYSNAQQLSDAQNEDHDNNHNNSAVEVEVDDIDVDVVFMSNAPVAFTLAHNNNNNNNNSNHLIEHKTASHRRARAAAVDVADVAVNVKNASANDNDGEVAQPNTFTDYEDNRKLLRLVMDGLGLRKLPDMTKVNISQQEYATKYREYLRRVHERKRRELADLVQPDGDGDAPLHIVSIVTNASEFVQRPRRKRDMHASIDAADAASMDAALISATNFSKSSTRLRQHYAGGRVRRRHNEKLHIVLHFPLNVDAGQLQPGDIEEANIRLMIIHSATLAMKHNNNNKNKSKRRLCGKAKQTSGDGGGVRQKHVLNLKVYQRLQAGKRLWLDGRKLDIVLDPSSSADDTHSQWLQFDVTRAVETWLRERHTNLGLEVQCDNCHRIGVRIVNDFATPLSYGADTVVEADYDADGYQLMPVLNIIGRLGVTYQEMRTRKHSNSADAMATAAYAHHNNVAGTLSGAQRLVADRHICRKANQRCCRHTMEVVFKEIKGFEFIIQPKVFDAGYCHGRCPPRFNPAHHHAMLQSLIWKQSRERAPRPCCAPSKLVELEVLHVDEKDSKKLKISTWTDMRVVECACS